MKIKTIDRRSLLQAKGSPATMRPHFGWTSQVRSFALDDNRTVAISLKLPFGANPGPGGNPSYSPTAQVLHRDPATGTDVELGHATSRRRFPEPIREEEKGDPS